MIGFKDRNTEVLFTKIAPTVVSTGPVPRFKVRGEVTIYVQDEPFTERFSGTMGLIEESKTPDPGHLGLSPLYLASWKYVLTRHFQELQKMCMST